MLERYEITGRDRLSPMFDMTFDLSAFDMFMVWEKGACLCWSSRKETIQPASFITDRELTVWFFGSVDRNLHETNRCFKTAPISFVAAQPILRRAFCVCRCAPCAFPAEWGEFGSQTSQRCFFHIRNPPRKALSLLPN